MLDNSEWIPNAKSECIRKWAENLHKEAKRLMIQDGTHANLLFLFNKENGLISINPVPPNIEHEHLNATVENAVKEHQLYGVIFIGESWAYFIKEKDHTAFQLLDGEMKVSDLNSEDKKEALIVRMENDDGDCLMYLDEIIRDKKGVTLKESLITESSQRKWFFHREDVLK